MKEFVLFAKPWWVNLFVFVPIVIFFFWKKTLSISMRTLIWSGVFGAAFGFVESSVVVYLRGALGLLKESKTHLPSGMFPLDIYRKSHVLEELPKYLLTVELYREMATIIMIFSIAILAAKCCKERGAIFFWVFAFWDIFYYIALKVSIGWPRFITDSDILFLLPVPWLSQVWYPILVSLLFIFAVFFSRAKI